MTINEQKITDQIKKNTLSFSSELEALFHEDYFSKSLGSVRKALILAFVLYASFGVLDLMITPLSSVHTWIIRYIIVCPVIAAAYIISYFKIYAGISQYVISAVALVAGFGILGMIYFAVEKEGKLYYYAGLILVIMWSYTLASLRYKYAAIISWAIIAGYELMIVFLQNLTSSPDLIPSFINNNFFFISSNIIGMMAGYYIELFSRKDFLQRLLIAEKQIKLTVERNELSARMNIMNNELNMTRIIQEQLIPLEHPRDFIYSLYKPMEAVGGDFFDFIKFRETNRIGIFLSDVSGHGVPSALITSMIKVTLLESNRYKDDPAKILAHLNDLLSGISGGHFITAFYGVFDIEEKTLIYSNAGHYPPMLISEGKILNLNKPSTLPLAILSNAELTSNNQMFENAKIKLPDHGKLFLFTDGLVEAKNFTKPGDDFSSILDEILLKYIELSPKEFINQLYKELISYRGSENFNDDICMIAVDLK
jgi:serine phosphatase RsbU (regulator of sigma subunit)